ncbi:MAG: hypothetical protein HC908_17405 [Calothrix sp. SM1_7_51]|nr:hypothetical protein [Calothrix sp. SM1_7_51]
MDSLSLIENSKVEIKNHKYSTLAQTFSQNNISQLFNTYPNDKSVNNVCQKAFDLAGIKPKDIGYLEVYGSGIKTAR